jgi:hypothetical protein
MILKEEILSSEEECQSIICEETNTAINKLL